MSKPSGGTGSNRIEQSDDTDNKPSNNGNPHDNTQHGGQTEGTAGKPPEEQKENAGNNQPENSDNQNNQPPSNDAASQPTIPDSKPQTSGGEAQNHTQPGGQSGITGDTPPTEPNNGAENNVPARPENTDNKPSENDTPQKYKAEQSNNAP